MVDSNVVGCSWIEIPAGKYHLRDKSHTYKDDAKNPPPISRSQIELDVSWEEFIAHQPEGEWSKVAPFRILSFDIECAGRKGISVNSDMIILPTILQMCTKLFPFLQSSFTSRLKDSIFI